MFLAEPTEKELDVGAVILGLLQGLQFNAHEIYGTRIAGKNRISNSKVQSLGVGIYRVASLFNHECNPALTRYFQGTDIILSSIRPISAGQMVSETYGPLFANGLIKDRQRALRSRYWFKCQCKACLEDWPILKYLTNYARLKCPTEHCDHYIKYPKDLNKQVKCAMCKKTVSLKPLAEMLTRCEM